ncbi:MAG TPA: hypothetical protein PKI20_00015 [Verrucomicrobiota bacterium]|nr:hypothetical protein [Verrucomicrobiota bacterium]HQL80328.1 hypothetical protein [Verrucomicrobiota bacterium]
MTNSGRLLLCAFTALVFWTVTRAIGNETSGDNPYQAIVDRNVFALKPPPPPPDPEANKPPPPKILLTGIYEMGGKKRVLMKVAMPARPPEPAKEVPLTLSEGQREGEIEVLEIDTVARTVKVDNFGTVTSLDFTNNGAKVAAAAAPGKVPGPGMPPGMPVPGVGMPGAGRPAPSGAAPSSFVPGGMTKSLPTTRPMRLGPTGASVSSGRYSSRTATASTYGGVNPSVSYGGAPAVLSTPNATAGAVAGDAAAGTVSLPGATAVLGGTTRQKNWPPEPTTPEEAAIREAAYALKNKAAIERGDLPPLPGSNPLLQDQTPPAQTTTPADPPMQPPLPPGAARTFPQ